MNHTQSFHQKSTLNEMKWWQHQSSLRIDSTLSIVMSMMDKFQLEIRWGKSLGFFLSHFIIINHKNALLFIWNVWINVNVNKKSTTNHHIRKIISFYNREIPLPAICIKLCYCWWMLTWGIIFEPGIIFSFLIILNS